MTKTLTATEQLVLTLVAGAYRISARTLAAELNITFDVARSTAKRLVKAGLLTSEVVREFESPDSASQSWLFGGATMCVRRRAYYTAVR